MTESVAATEVSTSPNVSFAQSESIETFGEVDEVDLLDLPLSDKHETYSLLSFFLNRRTKVMQFFPEVDRL